MNLLHRLRGEKEKKEVNAIYKEDISDILQQTDFSEEHELTCSRCGSSINEESIGAVTSEDGEVKFVCDNLHCIMETKDD